MFFFGILVGVVITLVIFSTINFCKRYKARRMASQEYPPLRKNVAQAAKLDSKHPFVDEGFSKE